MKDPERVMTREEPVEPDLSTEEVLSHLELGLWTAVVLIPILYWVNGPSVSHDQFVVRSVLAVIAYAGAPLLRWYRWRRRKDSNQEHSRTDEP